MRLIYHCLGLAGSTLTKYNLVTKKKTNCSRPSTINTTNDLACNP